MAIKQTPCDYRIDMQLQIVIANTLQGLAYWYKTKKDHNCGPFDLNVCYYNGGYKILSFTIMAV
jgi:hypothetical protein